MAMTATRPAGNRAGFVAEGVELHFRQDGIQYPDSRISRYTFKEGEFSGKTYVVRPATRYLFKANQPYRVNLRWNRAETILVATPVKLESLDEHEREPARAVRAADFERLPHHKGERPAFRHKRLGCITLLDEDMDEMPPPDDDELFVMVGTDRSVAFATRDRSRIKVLTEYNEAALEKVDWMKPMLLPWRPVNEQTLRIGVFNESDGFVRLEENRLIEDILSLPKRAKAQAIDEAMNRLLREHRTKWHSDRFEGRSDLTAGEKKTLLEMYQRNENVLKSAGFQMHQRRFYLDRREKAAAAHAAERLARIRQVSNGQAGMAPARPATTSKSKGLDARDAQREWRSALNLSGVTGKEEQLESMAIALVAYARCLPADIEPDNVAAIQLFDAAGIPTDRQPYLLKYIRGLQGIELEIEEPVDPKILTESWVEWLRLNRIGRKDEREGMAAKILEAIKGAPTDHRDADETWLLETLSPAVGEDVAKRITAKLKKGK